MRNNTFLLLFSFLILFLGSCQNEKKSKYTALEVRNKVDVDVKKLDKIIRPFDLITQIDHSRLAKAEDVYTPPAVVTIFSDKKVNANLLKKSQLIAVDLPFKVLLYSEPDTQNVSLAYTSAEFIQRRHGLSTDDINSFRRKINKVIGQFPQEIYAKNTDTKVNKEYGITIHKSSKPFQQTIDDLKSAILAQGDTKMFADIDFQKESKEVGIEIPPTYLILFGGPAPGGKAMHTTPRLGLDAFCQKLLVFQKGTGEVFIAFNSIEDFSELYYNTWTIPQKVIDFRLGSTLGGAVE